MHIEKHRQININQNTESLEEKKRCMLASSGATPTTLNDTVDGFTIEQLNMKSCAQNIYPRNYSIHCCC